MRPEWMAGSPAHEGPRIYNAPPRVSMLRETSGAEAWPHEARPEREGGPGGGAAWLPYEKRWRTRAAPRFDGAPGGSRTPDPRLRRPLLYPAELRAQHHFQN